MMWAAEEALVGVVVGAWVENDRGGGLNVEKRLRGIVGGVRRCLVGAEGRRIFWITGLER